MKQKLRPYFRTSAVILICSASATPGQNLANEHAICTELELTQEQLADNSDTQSLAWDFARSWDAGLTLRVKFMDGTARQQEMALRYANEWSQVANISFQYVASGPSDLRVAFEEGAGLWSYIGTDALGIPQNQRTMNIGLRPNSSETDYRSVVLHEFGHALGFIHEHQHPEANIPWNEVAAYEYYARTQNWSRPKVKANIFAKYSTDQLQWGRYDPSSIMHYPIPNFITMGDFEVGWNSSLSSGDRQNARNSYPRAGDYSPYWTTAGSGDKGWKIGDFDGDGKDDLLRVLSGICSSQVLLSDGDKFKKSGCWTTAGDGDRGWHIGDFNGDGKDDLMRIVSGVCSSQVYLSDGNGFNLDSCWTTAGDGDRGWHIGDFNGDGKDDLMRLVGGVCSSQVYLSDGNGFNLDSCWTTAGDGDRGWHIGDFNGDGKDDLLRSKGSCRAGVLLSDGAGFNSAGCWSRQPVGSSDWLIGDFDGDGRSDIATHEFGVAGAFVHLSTGSGLRTGVSWTAAEPNTRLGGWNIGDFDGDGRSDLFRALRKVTGANMFLSEGDRFSEFR